MGKGLSERLSRWCRVRKRGRSRRREEGGKRGGSRSRRGRKGWVTITTAITASSTDLTHRGC
jgi:hypothetical protein